MLRPTLAVLALLSLTCAGVEPGPQQGYPSSATASEEPAIRLVSANALRPHSWAL